MRPFLAIACAILVVTSAVFAIDPAALSSEQQSQLEQILHGSLENRGSWASIQAAEALIALNQTEVVIKAFRSQANVSEAPYRIGVWRVLARVQPTPELRDEYTHRIRITLLDTNASDHVHAMEALAKLSEPIVGDAERRLVQQTATDGGSARPFALWRLTQEKNADATRSLVALLRDPDATTRARAAYVLGKLRPPSSDTSKALKRALADEPIDSLARPAMVVAAGGEEVRRMASTAAAASARYAAAMYLAEEGTVDDRACLWKLVKDSDEDVREAAAFALLKIDLNVRVTPAQSGTQKD